jgi:hypothetical protein
MSRRSLALAAVLAVASATVTDALAAPERIIVLRHGEKGNAYRLCDVGVQRSLALVGRYLGRGADESLFGDKAPDAFFVITLHTLELASPSATSWQKPVFMYSVVPQPGRSDADTMLLLNQRTQQAAADVMQNWSGKTVVMIWEHHHIADAKLERDFPDQKVTLRQLLNLTGIDTVPKTWSGKNYDYFWIADYGPAGSDRPTRFEARKQSFAAPYQNVPSNDWDTKTSLPSECKS